MHGGEGVTLRNAEKVDKISKPEIALTLNLLLL